MIALYPIKPVYADRILSGEKTFELRRRLPKERLTHILIYSTTPIGKVIGYAKVIGIKQDNVDSLWERYSKQFGISKLEYFSYFEGNDRANALELSDVRKFVRPFSIKEISPNLTVPQSFCYIEKEHFRRLQKRKAEKI
jgi:predicted transcriptional regulator